MERLTELNVLSYLSGIKTGHLKFGVDERKAFDLLAAYEDTMPIERAQEIAHAEKNGRMVILPCKVGEYVWVDGCRAIVTEFFGYETERYLHVQYYDNMQYIDIPFREIGKTVFLTREEAEAALKKREEADDEAD